MSNTSKARKKDTTANRLAAGRGPLSDTTENRDFAELVKKTGKRPHEEQSTGRASRMLGADFGTSSAKKVGDSRAQEEVRDGTVAGATARVLPSVREDALSRAKKTDTASARAWKELPGDPNAERAVKKLPGDPNAERAIKKLPGTLAGTNSAPHATGKARSATGSAKSTSGDAFGPAAAKKAQASLASAALKGFDSVW